MREIKFRGKFVYVNTQSGQLDWVYGDLVQGPEHMGKHKIICEDGSQYEVLSSTVGQFTGLYDKNGKEIYEGDIVHLDAWEPDTMQIAFIEGAFCLADANGNYLGDIHYIHHAGVEQCTIVGNIYDNSKLLKEDEV